MSEFWKYFKDTLNFPLIHKLNALSVPIKGLAFSLDTVKSDILYLRDQFFPSKCDDSLVSSFSKSRAITKYYKESQDEHRKRVVNAYNWHLLGGKTVGLSQILDFYGFKTIRIDNVRDDVISRWAEFQVRLNTPTTHHEQTLIIEELEYLIWLINEYKPARSKLSRIYNDVWDIRPGVYDQGRYDDVAYDYFSGVDVPSLPDGEDILVSFGRKHIFSTPEALLTFLYVIRNRILTSHGILDDGMGYDCARYDSSIDINSGFLRSRLRSIIYGNPFYVPHTWEINAHEISANDIKAKSLWDARKWQEFLHVGYERQNFTFSHRRTALTEGTYDVSRYDDINSCYHQPIYSIFDASQRADVHTYDDYDVNRQKIVVDEKKERFQKASSFENLARFSKGSSTRKKYRAQLIDFVAIRDICQGFIKNRKRQRIYGHPIYADYVWANTNWDERLWKTLSNIGNIRETFMTTHITDKE